MSEFTGIDDVPLAFGKYKGKTPNEIAEIDNSYIIWLHENVPAAVSKDLAEACYYDDSEDWGNVIMTDWESIH